MKTRNTYLLFLGLLLILGGISVTIIFFRGHEEVKTNQNKTKLYTGSVKSCARNPEFPKKYGLVPPYLIDLRQKGYRGLRIIEYRENAKILMLPEWSRFGWLGMFTNDEHGNIYLSSIPHETTLYNPVGEQNRILRVDSETGNISEFMQLPQEQESTLRNPFGAMDLHYDCDTRHLYVSSLAGSTMKQALGSIFQIDLRTKEIIDRLENTDAIGIGTYNTVGGKRLYYGLAREPEVHSIALDDQGNFSGEPRFEFSLLEQPGGSFDKAHKIRFLDDMMEVKANNFTFTLAAASDPERNIYRFRYDVEAEKWNFLDVHLQKQ